MGKVVAMSFGVLALVACHSTPRDALATDVPDSNGGAAPSDSVEPSGGTAWHGDAESNEGAASNEGPARSDATAPNDGGLILVADGAWIEEGSNPFGIHGAVFAHADSTTSESLTSSIDGTRWCLAGTAAKVDLACHIVPPARDCFEMRFGAMLSLNLNQARSGDPAALEPKGIKGFSFELSGAEVPRFLHFTADAEDAVYCKRDSVGATTPTEEPAAHRQVLLADLIHANCNKSISTGPSAVAEGAKLVTLNWSVPGNYAEETPFEFCIENFRVLAE